MNKLTVTIQTEDGVETVDCARVEFYEDLAVFVGPGGEPVGSWDLQDIVSISGAGLLGKLGKD